MSLSRVQGLAGGNELGALNRQYSDCGREILLLPCCCKDARALKRVLLVGRADCLSAPLLGRMQVANGPASYTERVPYTGGEGSVSDGGVYQLCERWASGGCSEWGDGCQGMMTMMITMRVVVVTVDVTEALISSNVIINLVCCHIITKIIATQALQGHVWVCLPRLLPTCKVHPQQLRNLGFLYQYK